MRLYVTNMQKTVNIKSSIRADCVFRSVGNLDEIISVTYFKEASCEPQKAEEQEVFLAFVFLSTVQEQ